MKGSVWSQKGGQGEVGGMSEEVEGDSVRRWERREVGGGGREMAGGGQNSICPTKCLCLLQVAVVALHTLIG